MKSFTRAELLHDYVARKEGMWAPSTMETAELKLRTVLSYGITEPDFLFKKLEADGYGRYTIQSYFILARNFEEDVLKTSRLREWMLKHRFYFKNAYKKKTEAITEEQFQAFLKLAPTNELYNFLVLMGKGGLRKFEALMIKWQDLKNGELHVVYGKGGKQRSIPFDPSWLRGVRLDHATILPDDFTYWKFFKEKLQPFTPHDFRVFYATKVTNIAGLSIEDARDLLGHASITTTARYLRANKQKQSKLILENF